MGQVGPTGNDAIAKIKSAAQQYSLWLMVIGLATGFIGSNVLSGTPFEMTVVVAGGVILSVGALPLVLGALA